MNDLTKMKDFLPANFLDKMATGIAESRAATVLGVGGKPLLRLMKSGKWVFGQNNEPMQEGSRWVVNPVSLMHGFCCWRDAGGKNELAGNIMVSMSEPKPVKPDPIGGTPYVEQRSFDLKCLDGDDAGTEVQYKVNSYGGLNAVDGLLSAMQNHWAVDRVRVCPVLTFESESYIHKKYGETWNPIFNIEGWVDMKGDGDAGEAQVEEAAPAPKPAARPKKASLKVVDEPPFEADPKPTQRAHTGQRRRPGS